MTLLLEELGWPDVEEYLRRDDRLILVVGSTEQHGGFAPLGTDTYVALALAAAGAKRTGALAAPPLWFGWSQAPKQLTLHVPPDLRSGATLSVDEVPAANVYAFAFYIFQQLNRGPTDVIGR